MFAQRQPFATQRRLDLAKQDLGRMIISCSSDHQIRLGMVQFLESGDMFRSAAVIIRADELGYKDLELRFFVDRNFTETLIVDYAREKFNRHRASPEFSELDELIGSR